MICVTPLAGVWIEMPIQKGIMSWWRRVTPLAGVWIEIFQYLSHLFCCGVTPLAGVWIEM